MNEVLPGMVGFSPLPIGDIVLQQGCKRLVYSPKSDVTTAELSHLLMLFSFGVASTARYSNYDWLGFIEKHGLQRHFEEVK